MNVSGDAVFSSVAILAQAISAQTGIHTMPALHGAMARGSSYRSDRLTIPPGEPGASAGFALRRRQLDLALASAALGPRELTVG
eukprot:6830007-Heterocapsa_arctica.AAC.1